MNRWTGHGFKSYSGQSCITTLGKLFTPGCLCQQAVSFGISQVAVMLCSWEGNRRSGESNFSLLMCGLTTCTPGSVLGPMLGNKYGMPLPFLPVKINIWQKVKIKTHTRWLRSETPDCLKSGNLMFVVSGENCKQHACIQTKVADISV